MSSCVPYQTNPGSGTPCGYPNGRHRRSFNRLSVLHVSRRGLRRQSGGVREAHRQVCRGVGTDSIHGRRSLQDACKHWSFRQGDEPLLDLLHRLSPCVFLFQIQGHWMRMVLTQLYRFVHFLKRKAVIPFQCSHLWIVGLFRIE